MTEQKTALDFEAMRRAIEGLDADDAEMRIVNKNDTPTSPRIVRGKEEITAYLRDVCGRAMTHLVHNEVIGEDRVAFNEACEYAEGGAGGGKVLAAITLDVRDGKITRQTNVEAWDE